MTNANDHLPAPPRAVRARGRHRLARILFTALLVLRPGGIATGSWFEARDLTRLADEGVVAQGRITDLRTHRARRSSTKYYVDYAFAVDGRTFPGSTEIGKRTWQGLETGDVAQVCYWPTDPSVNHFGTVATTAAGRALWQGELAAALVAVAIGVVLFLTERRLRRHLALLRDGRALVGEVTAYETKRRRGVRAVLSYRFPQPAGAEVVGKDRLEKALDPAPESGGVVVVLQSLDDPKVHASLQRVLEFAELEA